MDMTTSQLPNFPSFAISRSSKSPFLPHSNPSISFFPPYLRFVYTVIATRSRRWNSNAEIVQAAQRFNFDFRNKEDNDDDDGESDDEIPSGFGERTGMQLLDEIFDSIYIFKVFRSYGWMLPPILLSMLLASGLKAFLIALAVPLGQSTLTLAFKKLTGQTVKTIKRAPRSKTKPFFRQKTGVKTSQERENLKYRPKVDRNAGSVKNASQGGFKGWD